MNRRDIFGLSAIAALALALLPGSAFSQQKSLREQIVGTWTFVSALDVKPDGTKSDRWGPNPKGIFIFDTNGRFAQFITRSDIPKFAAKSVDQGTAQENKAVLAGLVPSFGTYTVNEADKTVITRVEENIFSNPWRSRAKAADRTAPSRRAKIQQPFYVDGNDRRSHMEAREITGNPHPPRFTSAREGICSVLKRRQRGLAA